MATKTAFLLAAAIHLTMNLMTNSAHATEVSSSHFSVLCGESCAAGNRSFALFIQLTGGLNGASVDSNLHEVGRSGRVMGAGLSASYKFDHFLLDASGGYEANQTRSGFTDVGLASSVNTQSAFLAFKPKVSLDGHIQAGAIGKALFGTNVNFSPYVNQSALKTAVFAGFGLYYEAPIARLLSRTGLEITTDVNVKDRQILSGVINFEIGLPFSNQL